MMSGTAEARKETPQEAVITFLGTDGTFWGNITDSQFSIFFIFHSFYFINTLNSSLIIVTYLVSILLYS